MSYRIEWEQDAAKALDNLGSAAVEQILLRADWLAANLDSIKLKALTGNLRGYFKLRAGDYRIVYSVNRTDELLVIHDVGHRRNIYKDNKFLRSK